MFIEYASDVPTEDARLLFEGQVPAAADAVGVEGESGGRGCGWVGGRGADAKTVAYRVPVRKVQLEAGAFEAMHSEILEGLRGTGDHLRGHRLKRLPVNIADSGKSLLVLAVGQQCHAAVGHHQQSCGVGLGQRREIVLALVPDRCPAAAGSAGGQCQQDERAKGQGDKCLCQCLFHKCHLLNRNEAHRVPTRLKFML